MTNIDALLAKDKALHDQYTADADAISTDEINALIKEVREAGYTTGAAASRKQLQDMLQFWAEIVEKRAGYKPGLFLPTYDPEAAAAEPEEESDTAPPDEESLDGDNSLDSEPAMTARYIPGEASEEGGMTLAQLFMTMPTYAKVGILVVIALLLAAILYAVLSPKSEDSVDNPAATETAVAAAITASAQPTKTATPTATPRIYIQPETSVQESAPVGTPTPITYVVQTQDTLNKIASKYGVTVQDIAVLNNIYNVNSIAVGQELLIPTPLPGTSLPPGVSPAQATSAPPQPDAGQTAATTAPGGPRPELVIRGPEMVELRIAAGADYQSITSLPPGTFAVIIAKTPDGQWYLIQLEDGFTRGWISAASAALLYPANPDTLPTTPTP